MRFRPTCPAFVTFPAALLAAAALVSCGGGVGAGVQPKDFNARDALGSPAPACAGEPKLARPLIVDLDPDARIDLETAMKKGVVAVAYDCNTLRVVSECKVTEAGYDYVGVYRKEKVVQLKGSDELKVNLPLSANKLGAEVQAGRSIDLGLVYVGKRSAVVGKVKRAELEGSCEGVTHYLRNAIVGAFAISTGATGKAAAVAELFQVGASAKSESSRQASSSDGSLEACRSSKAGSEAPPDECGSPLQVELIPITGDAPAPAEGASAAVKGKPEAADEKSAALEAKKALAQKVEANPCRDGYVLTDGICARAGGDAFLCNPGDGPTCKAQCEKGNAGSCFNYGALVADKGGDGGPSFEKACKGGTTDACVRIASDLLAVVSGEVPAAAYKRGLELSKGACDAGNADGCFWASYATRYQPGAAAAEEASAFGYLRRGCRLGDGVSCRHMAEAYIKGEGVAKDVNKGLAAYTKACEGDDDAACNELVTQLRPINADRALALALKTCGSFPDSYTCVQSAELLVARGQYDKAYPYAKKACDSSEYFCMPLAKMHHTGKGVKVDTATAQAFVDKVCSNKTNRLLDRLSDDSFCDKPVSASGTKSGRSRR